MVIIDTIWEPKVQENLKRIKDFKNRVANPKIVYVAQSLQSPISPSAGSWERKFWETLAEARFWQQNWEDPSKLTKAEVLSQVTLEERQTMKDTAHSWLKEIVDSTNEETGKINDYDSEVPRIKGTNYHQRGHFFIFYENDTPQNPQREHWLALYPPFNDSELHDGHTHRTFILEFDKPVKKFVDVYACIGCGAAEQGYTALHEHYDIDSNNPSDSWEIIHKGCPFEPWFTEFTTDLRTGSDGGIITKSGKCLGNRGNLNDVWQGATIQDLEKGTDKASGKTFDKAYGYIPQDGTIQWKLSRDIKNETDWIKKRIPYHMDKLWGKNEFISYKDKTVYQQKAMDMTIDELLQEKQYVIGYLKDKCNEDNINQQLERELRKRFWKLISAKRNAYNFLEEWIKKIVLSSDKTGEITNCENAFDQLLLLNEPQVIKEIWGRQVEKFIREGKVKEISSRLGINLTTYNQAKGEIDLLYQKFFDKLEFNQRVENIQQLEQVAQIVVNP